MARLKREFSIEDDLTQPIDNYSRFKDRLEKLSYVARIATQEPEAITQIDSGKKGDETQEAQGEEPEDEEAQEPAIVTVDKEKK